MIAELIDTIWTLGYALAGWLIAFAVFGTMIIYAAIGTSTYAFRGLQRAARHPAWARGRARARRYARRRCRRDDYREAA
ncbi:hypothetical protein [Streptomyces spinosisporus]|uniref:Uncharacterized protein n=1 Tax=Streptomyces spinosisporus TaxID=2927582 RepID=A0ABS9XE20_9ACTN|nr:hypothetical protein [Streptomyces spinosisporus]MCI3240258.1 hypothetical protein [Streptomyces spinosisporus]